MLDMVFLVRVLHDLNRPVEMLETLAASLKPGGKIVIVELEKDVRDERDLHHSMIRQDFMDVFAKTSFAVDRTDKSLPDPRSVVFVLSRKQAAKPSATRTAGQVSKALEFALGNRPGGELENSTTQAPTSPTPRRPTARSSSCRPLGLSAGRPASSSRRSTSSRPAPSRACRS
jgi:SAM-dependent methyltransferase